ncbi:VIER F-box protein 1 [Perilla frutescens var. hirtella]|uniref:VIER F-box protein 1 n=1 Tax=Perilla frutescens var. hirtella TaxID=608512 RepID=A0AAD4IXU8_PERFH|nr:VIER F-box protein 1 [Perilla frutescens var. hirtella]
MGQTTSTHHGGDSAYSDNQSDQQDYTTAIPDGCLALIFQRLSSDERNGCLLVCRRWLTVEAQNRHRLTLSASTRVTLHLPAIFNRFDSVTELALHCDRNSVSINDQALILISLRCRNLTRLKLRRCREVSAVGILAIAQNCNSLRKFSCRSCTFGERGVAVLLKNCSSLEELSIKRLHGITDGGEVAEPVGPGLAGSSIRSITLKKLHNAQCFASLITESNNLTTLKIIGCSGNNWDKLLYTLAARKNFLTEIHLEKLEVSDIGLMAISKCSNLKRFHLAKTPYCSNEGISAIAKKCKLLKKLHIDGCRTNRINDWGLMEIAKNSIHLVKLVLVGVNPSSDSLMAIASNCRKLQKLALCGSNAIGDDEISCMAAECKVLKKVWIKRCRVTDSGIEALANGCPNLVMIKVEKCRGVSRGVLQMLRERREALVVDLYVDEGEAKLMNSKVLAILFIFTFYLLILLRNYLI